MDYTVVLRYPEYLRDITDGVPVYVANRIEARGVREALKKARREAFNAQPNEDRAGNSPDDFAHIVTFIGHNNPVHFGE